MKRLLVCFSCVLFGGLTCFAQLNEAVAQIEEADVHALLRETAVKVEERFRGVHEEADELAQSVDEILAAPTPPKTGEGDRNQQRAAAMQLMSMSTGASATLASVRGFVFDDSRAGHSQRYQELEAAKHDDEGDVLRWLEMRHMAGQLKWEEKEKLCEQRALGAARALVAREPKNAEAHALLAAAMRWENPAETLKTLHTALDLDARLPRALELMLDRRILKALESAALRRESGLDEKVPTHVERLLYDKPLSEEEMLTLGKKQDELRREAELLLKLAQERGDLATYLLTLERLAKLRRHARMAALAAKRGPDVSYEQYLQQTLQSSIQLFFTIFADEGRLREALRLAADDAEATGAVMLVALTADAMAAFSTGKAPSAARMTLAEETTRRLAVMAGADSSLKAARASESACIIQLIALMLGHKPPHADMILRTIRLDPFRHRTLNMLLALCMQKQDVRGARAVTQIQLALVPDHETRRIAAAAASKMQDWPAAQRLLDACLKEKPNDVSLLNQRAATLLRENQSKATQRRAAVIYDKIEKLLEEDKAALPDRDNLEVLVQNGVLFLTICGRSEEAENRLAAAVKAGMISEKGAKELEQWLR